MLSDIKAVIFDIDGTIMDSVDRIVECMKLACKETGLKEPSEQAAKDIIGLTLHEAVETLYPSESADVVATAVESYKRIYTELEDKKPTCLFADTILVFKTLRERGYRIGIATGKSRKGYNRVITNAGLGGYIDVSCTGDEVRSKPDPQMLLRLSDELLLPTQACLMVGDSILDLGMAQKAIMPGAGVTTGVHDRKHLQEMRPMLVVDSLSELLQHLRSL